MTEDYVLNLQRMFEHACEFSDCAGFCEVESNSIEYRMRTHAVSGIVNSVFACEIFIKTLLVFHGRTIAEIKEHQLKKLWEEFKKEDYEIAFRIEERIREWLQAEDDNIFNRLISEASDAFERWRYIYELQDTTINIKFLMGFRIMLRETCCNQLFGKPWCEYKNVVNDKETLLGEGIEGYEKYAFIRIFYLEYGVKNLLETVIEEVNEIPKFEVYIVLSEPNGRSIIYKKAEKECVDKKEFYIDTSAILGCNRADINNISEILNIREDELFIQTSYVKQGLNDYQIRLVIYTEDYSKFTSLKYFYERFAFASGGTLGFKKYSPVVVSNDLVNTAVHFIYTEFGYMNQKCIPDFSIITKLSAMTYESNKCKARIIFTHEVKNLNIKFANPVLLDIYNLRAIRKLLEVANDKFALIINWRTEEENLLPIFEAVGFANEEDYQQCVQFQILGYLQWKLLDGEKTILNYRQGRYVVVKEDSFDDRYLRQCLNTIFGGNAESDRILNIVNKSLNQLHGTTLIITSEAQEEVSRLCDKKRGYQIAEIELDKQSNLVENITCIDGAVIMDECGKCFGIGVILDGKCIVSGNQARGARYNSAYNYIAIMSENKKNAIAVVISEDRTVDVITSQNVFG